MRQRIASPAKPESFPLLRQLSDADLQVLEANSTAIDDWILDLAEVKCFSQRVKDLRQENVKLAEEILLKEQELNHVTAQRSEALREEEESRKVVEALGAKRDEILNQRSPQQLAEALLAKAHAADAEAERTLQEALSAPGSMDAAQLAQFRLRFVQQKAEKHWRLAMKEALLNGAVNGTQSLKKTSHRGL